MRKKVHGAEGSAAPAYKPSQVLRLSPLSHPTSPPAPEKEVLDVL